MGIRRFFTLLAALMLLPVWTGAAGDEVRSEDRADEPGQI